MPPRGSRNRPGAPRRGGGARLLRRCGAARGLVVRAPVRGAYHPARRPPRGRGVELARRRRRPIVGHRRARRELSAGSPGRRDHRVEPSLDFSGRSEIARREDDDAMCPFALDPSKDARSGRAAGDALRGGRHNAGRRGATPRRGARRQPPASMSSREICKYFLHGACRNGASCRFSHQMDAPKSTVCTYYLAGNCAYGDKCRYDHVRPKVGHASASTRAQTPRGARVPGRCARRIDPHPPPTARATTVSWRDVGTRRRGPAAQI